ncbi:MAG: hypothetical protein AAFU71_09875 [Cyanobacteria bacterium J06632_22]
MGNSTLTRTLAVLGLTAVALGGVGLPAMALEVTGRSGGSENSECGYIRDIANHTVEISDAVAPLNVEVSSSGNYSLFIESDNGYSECVRSHSYDGGTIESMGAVPAGIYRLYVGDFDGASHPFEMTINE